MTTRIQSEGDAGRAASGARRSRRVRRRRREWPRRAPRRRRRPAPRCAPTRRHLPGGRVASKPVSGTARCQMPSSIRPSTRISTSSPASTASMTTGVGDGSILGRAAAVDCGKMADNNSTAATACLITSGLDERRAQEVVVHCGQELGVRRRCPGRHCCPHANHDRHAPRTTPWRAFARRLAHRAVGTAGVHARGGSAGHADLVLPLARGPRACVGRGV